MGPALALILVVLAASASVLLDACNTDPSYVSVHMYNLTRVTRHRSRPQTVAPLGHRYNRLSSSLSVINDVGFVYLIHVSVGGQDLPVILDTGSSDLWVASTSCGSPDCTSVPRYDPANSTTLHLPHPLQPFQLSYLIGAVEGNVVTETVLLGPFEISNQVLALAEKVLAMDLGDTGNSGILGLAFPRQATIPSTVGAGLLTNLFSSVPPRDDRGPFFAFKLGRSTNASQDSSAGVSSFTIGGLDQDVVGKDGLDGKGFSYFNVSKAGTRHDSGYDFWKLPLRSITIDSVPLPRLSDSLVPNSPSKLPIAVLDSGTTLILGPSRDVKMLWDTIGSSRLSENGQWEVRCERGVLVRFALGDGVDGGVEGTEYALHPGDVNWKEGGEHDGWCMGGIQANDKVNSGDWLLGDVFLRNVYVTHHFSRSPIIGLLNMTNPTLALSEFRLEWGPDSVSIRSTAVPNRHGNFSVPVFTLSSVGGFLSGGLLTVIVLLRRQRLIRRKSY